jgi:hypothetical protein
VERSATEIAANDLTEFRTNGVVTKINLNEGAPKIKKVPSFLKALLIVVVVVVVLIIMLI